MADDDKLIITPDEAASLLEDGKYVHNFVNPGGMLVGCDYERDRAIEAFRKAVQIEIGGPACKNLRHPIIVWDSDNHYSFFAADMAKVAALEAAKLQPVT